VSIKFITGALAIEKRATHADGKYFQRDFARLYFVSEEVV